MGPPAEAFLGIPPPGSGGGDDDVALKRAIASEVHRAVHQDFANLATTT